MSIKVCVIIAAAGSGRRMGGLNKIVQPVGGRPVLTWSLALFEQSPAVDEIIIAAAEEQVELLRALAAPYGKVTAVVAGGNSRAASVSRALAAASPRVSHIAVHDAARPLLSSADWQALLAAAAKAPGGVILAARPSDSAAVLRTATASATSGSASTRERVSRVSVAAPSEPATTTSHAASESTRASMAVSAAGSAPRSPRNAARVTTNAAQVAATRRPERANPAEKERIHFPVLEVPDAIPDALFDRP